MIYDLRRVDVAVKWLVSCLLATFGIAYMFGAWMVGLYAGFTPKSVAATYAEPEMAMHVPMYGVIAAALSLVALGLPLARSGALALITLLFAAPWLDFAGMWLTKLASPRFAAVTLLGGWAMGAGYTVVTALALWHMWKPRKGAS